ncbi:alpha/beta hydrolase [Archangium lansingense]|uniref:alpha/beta hydrolase n=1 Tax=Archangium lansingense TaxID=2995310 RepID=UPI003B7D25DE
MPPFPNPRCPLALGLALVAVLTLAGCGPTTAQESEPFHSTLLERDFILHSYVPAEHGGELPVVLVLDGNSMFDPVVEALEQGLARGELEPAVVIGIAYAGSQNARNTDFTPVPDDRIPDSGGASQYFDFVEQELLPHLESRFPISRSKEDRALFGHSFGGLAGAYALFERPELFGRYGLASPSLWYGDGITYSWEETRAAGSREWPVTIWMSTGAWEGAEMAGGFEFLDTKLRSRNYTGLRYESALIPAQGHLGSFTESLQRATEFVLKKEEQP